jgi:hypothetical protein
MKYGFRLQICAADGLPHVLSQVRRGIDRALRRLSSAPLPPWLEYRMRVPVALLIAGGLIGCTPPPKPPAPVVAAFVPPAPVPPTQNAPICAKPPEKAAFEVAGLKSQLMVTALSCDSQTKYDQFIVRYRKDLLSDEKEINGFFGRAYGKRGQTEHDDYVTQLANAQSDLRNKSGDQFCHLNASLLDEALALKSGADLPQFAESKPIQQSLAVQECAATPVAEKKTTVRKVVKAAPKKK